MLLLGGTYCRGTSRLLCRGDRCCCKEAKISSMWNLRGYALSSLHICWQRKIKLPLGVDANPASPSKSVDGHHASSGDNCLRILDSAFAVHGYASWHSAEVGNYIGLVSASCSEVAAIPTELAWTTRHHNVHDSMGGDARRVRTIASQIRNVILLRRGKIA